MALFKNFKIKLLISVIIAVISSLYQLESRDEFQVTEKVVMLSKNRQECYEFVTKFEEYATWFPNINSIEPIDSQKHMTVSRRFKIMSTYLFGIGEATSQITVIGYQKPNLFEYLSDNSLMERNRLELKQLEGNKTLLTWGVYSRRKSLLFRYSAGLLYQFYYSQLLREALFSLQFMMKK